MGLCVRRKYGLKMRGGRLLYDLRWGIESFGIVMPLGRQVVEFEWC